MDAGVAVVERARATRGRDRNRSRQTRGSRAAAPGLGAGLINWRPDRLRSPATCRRAPSPPRRARHVVGIRNLAASSRPRAGMPSPQRRDPQLAVEAERRGGAAAAMESGDARWSFRSCRSGRSCSAALALIQISVADAHAARVLDSVLTVFSISRASPPGMRCRSSARQSTVLPARLRARSDTLQDS